MKQKRLKHADRRVAILDAMIPLAMIHGYRNVTRDQVAHATGISGSAVQYHFGTVESLRVALLRYAVQNECLLIIAQAVVAGEPGVTEWPASLRRAALEFVARRR